MAKASTQRKRARPATARRGGKVARRLFRGRRRRATRRAKRTTKRIGRARMVMFKNLIQPKVRTVLRYVDTKTLAATSSLSNHVYNMNDIYDPDRTGSGHQPAYHDQWKVYYTNYRVIAVRWSITYRLQTDASLIAAQAKHTTPSGETIPYGVMNDLNYHAVVGYESSDDTVVEVLTAANKNFLREVGRDRRNVQWRYIGGDAKNGRTVTLRGSANLANVIQDRDDFEMVTNFGLSPDHRPGLNVACMSVDGNYTAPCTFHITMDFTCEFSDLKTIASS